LKIVETKLCRNPEARREADGYVIIDHKDYPGQEAEERAAKYIPQMQAYRAAVERATGRPVIDVLLHLPISGMVMRLG
jgi:ATP-dependent helicase/nuclease subunit A